MKKIKYLILILAVIILTGCDLTDKKVTKDKDIYIKYVKELKNVEKSSNTNLPFDIEVKYDKLTKDEVRFQVIIDNPRENLTDISAVAIHDKPTDNVFPSTGIFEEKQTLSPNKKPSGIILVGYIPYEGKLKDFKCKVKVLVKYSQKDSTRKIYYVTKKD